MEISLTVSRAPGVEGEILGGRSYSTGGVPLAQS